MPPADPSHLLEIMRDLLASLKPGTQATIANKALAIGHIRFSDGLHTLVYTVSDNWVNDDLAGQAERFGLTRWEAVPDAPARVRELGPDALAQGRKVGDRGGAWHAEQLLHDAMPDDASLRALAISRDPCVGECEVFLRTEHPDVPVRWLGDGSTTSGGQGGGTPMSSGTGTPPPATTPQSTPGAVAEQLSEAARAESAAVRISRATSRLADGIHEALGRPGALGASGLAAGAGLAAAAEERAARERGVGSTTAGIDGVIAGVAAVFPFGPADAVVNIATAFGEL
jgi:hypothetical protein